MLLVEEHTHFPKTWEPPCNLLTMHAGKVVHMHHRKPQHAMAHENCIRVHKKSGRIKKKHTCLLNWSKITLGFCLQPISKAIKKLIKSELPRMKSWQPSWMLIRRPRWLRSSTRSIGTEAKSEYGLANWEFISYKERKRKYLVKWPVFLLSTQSPVLTSETWTLEVAGLISSDSSAAPENGGALGISLTSSEENVSSSSCNKN